MSGWIKLHRKFNDWEWRNSPKHVAVFLDLLLNANHKEKKYRGVLIGAGQLTTSYQAISERTGVTIRGVRTVLKDLISTHEVTHEGRRHYSIITIVNWEKYQVPDIQNDIVMTSRRQPNDKLVTTNKNEKNVNNEKNICAFDFEAAYKNYPLKKGKKRGVEKIKKQIKTPEQYSNFCRAVDNYRLVCEKEQTESRYIKHFSTFVGEWEDWVDLPDDFIPKTADELFEDFLNDCEAGRFDL